MKKLSAFGIVILLIVNSLSAKTYTLTSGKWTDPGLWGDNYPGALVKSADVVIITGAVVINIPVIVEGTLRVEKGASMVGIKDLVISKSGTFINNGNTVMEHIVNEGTVMNNMSMDAINDIDNTGRINNTSNMVAGNNFNNNGTVEGKKSTYIVQNSLISSAQSKFGAGMRFFCGNTIQGPADVPSSADNNGSPVPNRSQPESDSLYQMMRSVRVPDGN